MIAAEIASIEKSDLWVDQANTCWTGVELAFASFLIYEGFVEDGQNVISCVNTRYRKAGLYWDHQEFGGHYYRAMSAWSILHSYLGLGINCGTYTFAPKLNKKSYSVLFSHGNGLANFVYNNGIVKINILSGTMQLNALALNKMKISSSRPSVYIDKKGIKGIKVKEENGNFTFQFPRLFEINENSIITIK